MATKSKVKLPSKPTLRKVDKAATINKAIDKKIAEKKASASKNYKMSREVRPKSNGLSTRASEMRGLSNDYYRRYEKDLKDAKALEGQYRYYLKNHIANTAKMIQTKSPKKSDAQGTYDLAVKNYEDKLKSLEKSTLRQKLGASMGQNELYWKNKGVEQAKKKVEQLSKYNKRVQKKK